MGAMPMGAPGWPLLAFCTISAERMRNVLMVLFWMFIPIVLLMVIRAPFVGGIAFNGVIIP